MSIVSKIPASAANLIDTALANDFAVRTTGLETPTLEIVVTHDDGRAGVFTWTAASAGTRFAGAETRNPAAQTQDSEERAVRRARIHLNLWA